jgi:hypothetical protein
MAVTASNLLDFQALESLDGVRYKQVARVTMAKPSKVSPVKGKKKIMSDRNHEAGHHNNWCLMRSGDLPAPAVDGFGGIWASGGVICSAGDGRDLAVIQSADDGGQVAFFSVAMSELAVFTAAPWAYHITGCSRKGNPPNSVKKNPMWLHLSNSTITSTDFGSYMMLSTDIALP